MGVRDYLRAHDARQTVKAVEIDGITVHIRRMTLAESARLAALDDDAERIKQMLLACLVNDDGSPALTEADAELIMNAEDAALAPLVEAIADYNSAGK